MSLTAKLIIHEDVAIVKKKYTIFLKKFEKKFAKPCYWIRYSRYATIVPDKKFEKGGCFYDNHKPLYDRKK